MIGLLSLSCYLACLCLSSVLGVPVNQLVDLSHKFDQNTPTWPDSPRFNKSVHHKGYLPAYGNIWLESYKFCSSEHVGTHMDAPVHFSKNGKTADMLPMDTMYRVNGVKIDMTAKIVNDADYEITVSDLEDWVKTHGEFPDGVVVLLETGWGKKALDEAAYSGLDEHGHYHYPGIGPEGAEWLKNYANRTGQERGVLAYGVDTYSLDIGNTSTYPAHQVWLIEDGTNRYGLENLNNLDKLPARDFILTILLMHIDKATGGATRIIAEIGGKPYITPTLTATTTTTTTTTTTLAPVQKKDEKTLL